MPVLEPYKDGHGYYNRIGYGESGIGTWQIGPAGVRWLMSCNRLRPDWIFSRADFEYLKGRGLILNGGRQLQQLLGQAPVAKPIAMKRTSTLIGTASVRTRTVESGELTSDGRPKRIHYVTLDAPAARPSSEKSKPGRKKRSR